MIPGSSRFPSRCWIQRVQEPGSGPEPEDTVRVPLWDEGGLLPEEPEWLNRALGLSPDLVADLAAWGDDWNAPRSGLTNEQHIERDRRLATEARALIERLRDELPKGYTIAHEF